MTMIKVQRTITSSVLVLLLYRYSIANGYGHALGASAFSPSPNTSTRPTAFQSQLLRPEPLSMASSAQDDLFMSSSSSNSSTDATVATAAAAAAAPQFGDVVTMRPSSATAPNAAQFGDAVQLGAAAASRPGGRSAAAAAATNGDDAVLVAASIQRRNLVTAVVAIAIAVSNYLWILSHPVTPVQLLMSMQGQSDSITIVGSNSKPTVVDFWAPWCENCKLIAPTLLKVEEEYKDRVNFVMIDGDKEAAWPYIEAFGVDAIPHLALVSANGNVETALIGPIPKHVLEADLDVLIKNAAEASASASAADDTTATYLPYKMLDVFANKPTARRLHFDQ